jgi:hypothetical protein
VATDIGAIYARLVLDRSQFTRELAAAKEEARAFGDVVVPIDANPARFDAASVEVFAAKRAMAEPVDATVGADTAPFDLGAAHVSALKKAMARPVDVPVEIDASKLGLFKRLVGGGESPGDVAKYLGFSKAELSAALGALAVQAAQDARAQFSEAGAYAAEQMVAGWMAAAQRELGSGSAMKSGFYRLLTGGSDPYMSTGGAIPMPPSDPGWRYWSAPLALGPGGAEGPIPAGAEGPIPAGTVGDTGPGLLSRLGGFFTGRMGGRTGDGGSGGLGVLAPIAAAGGVGALLSGLLWGGGSAGFMGIGGGMAGVGSLASFGGLGPEHLLMTLLGLGGNAAGGLAGGALLGLGSLGVMGVGMGTDMAGIGQAAGDIKSAYSIIGNSALTAAQKQRQLNQALHDLTPAARSAVMSAATTATQFHAMFDRLTGPAEAIGARIIQQAMLVGEKFLPTIGKFAAQNMGIIQSSLQPLFSWLQGPGLTIFTQLEAKFQQDLPTAMHAFDQGVELLMRTIGLIAPKTGGLIHAIDRLVTKFNGAGWGTWSAGINKLIGDFRRWEALVKILVADIYQLFHHDAGTGSAIVVTLTQMLTKLHAWETSVQGGKALHSIFVTHKAEVIALLRLLPNLISVFGRLYLTVAPTMTEIVTGLVKMVGFMQGIPGAGALLSWGLAVGILANKIGLLRPLAGVIDRALGALIFGNDTTFIAGITGQLSKLASLAWGTLAGGIRAVAAAFGAMDLSMQLLTGVGVVALAVGIYELIKHFGVLPGLMIAGAVAVGVLTVAMIALDTVPVVALVVGIGLAIVGLIAGIIWLAEHWRTVWDGIRAGTVGAVHGIEAAIHFLTGLWPTITKDAAAGFKAVVGFFKTLWPTIEKGASAGFHAVVGFFKTLWKDITKDAAAGAKAFVEFFKKLPGEALKALKALPHDLGFLAGYALATMALALVKAAKAVWDFFTQFVPTVAKKIGDWAGALGKLALAALAAMASGIATGAKAVWDFFTALPGKTVGFLTGLPGDLSKSGSAGIGGMVAGITAAAGDIWSFFKALPGGIVAAFGDAWSILKSVGEHIMGGLLRGIESAGSAVVGAVTGFIGGLISGAKRAAGIKSPSTKFHAIGVYMMEGLANGIHSGSGQVSAAMDRVNGLVLGAGNGMTIGVGSVNVNGAKDRVAELVATQHQTLVVQEKLVATQHQTLVVQEKLVATQHQTLVVQEKLVAENVRLRTQVVDLLGRLEEAGVMAADASQRTANALTNLPGQVALLKRTGAL